jgi:hypothetical protein
MKLPKIVLVGGPFDGLELSVQEPLLPRFEIRGRLLSDHGYYELAAAFKNYYGVYRRSRRKCGATRYRFEFLRRAVKAVV